MNESDCHSVPKNAELGGLPCVEKFLTDGSNRNERKGTDCHGFQDHDFPDDRRFSYGRQCRLASSLCGGRGVLVPRDRPPATQRTALAIRVVRGARALARQRDVGLPRIDLGTI